MRIFFIIVYLINFTKYSYGFNNLFHTENYTISYLRSCNENCIEPYGKLIGINNNVPSFSNCKSLCINRPGFAVKKEISGFIKDVWIGLPWQCVEYVRRWVLENQKIEFDDVDYAYEIWDRKVAQDLKSGEYISYLNFLNGSEFPPKYGDIIVYDKSFDLPYGHVAIITNVNVIDRYIDIAEENFLNNMWENFYSYSRRIKLVVNKNKYYISNISFKNDSTYFSKNINILGWKRLNKE